MSENVYEKVKHIFAVKPKKNANKMDIDNFLKITAEVLPSIPGVSNLNIYRQINDTNEYEFIVSMDFKNIEAYKNYNNHPIHEKYVKQVWSKIAGEIIIFDLKQLKLI